MTHPSLVELLIEQGKMSQEDADKLSSPNHDWGSLRRNLVESQIVSERELCELMGESLGIPFVPFDQFPKEPLLLNNLTLQFMRENLFLPIRMENGELTIITHDPFDF
jgi:hypothetical protein